MAIVRRLERNQTEKGTHSHLGDNEQERLFCRLTVFQAAGTSIKQELCILWLNMCFIFVIGGTGTKLLEFQANIYKIIFSLFMFLLLDACQKFTLLNQFFFGQTVYKNTPSNCLQTLPIRFNFILFVQQFYSILSQSSFTVIPDLNEMFIHNKKAKDNDNKVKTNSY